jgi:hypothetical protein
MLFQTDVFGAVQAKPIQKFEKFSIDKRHHIWKDTLKSY